jgi:SsrA-binding protein
VSSRRKRRAQAGTPATTRPGVQTLAVNRRARHDYEVLGRLRAGIMLTGSEIKSVRNRHVSLAEGFVTVDDGEAYLRDVHIARYEPAAGLNHDATRPRKLLLHRDEISTLARHVDGRGLTAIPLQLLLARGWAKVEIGLVRGRRQYDKREKIRAKEDAREISRHLG